MKLNRNSVLVRLLALLAFSVLTLALWHNADLVNKTDPGNYSPITEYPQDLLEYLDLENKAQYSRYLFWTKDTIDNNTELLVSFFTRVNKGFPAMLRSFDITEEGDFIITDLVYEPDSEQFIINYDFTRDVHSSGELETRKGYSLVIFNREGKVRVCLQDPVEEAVSWGAFSVNVRKEDFVSFEKLFAKLEKKGLGECNPET